MRALPLFSALSFRPDNRERKKKGKRKRGRKAQPTISINLPAATQQEGKTRRGEKERERGGRDPPQ